VSSDRDASDASDRDASTRTRTGEVKVVRRVRSTGFFVTVCFGALATVAGAGGLFFEFRDHDQSSGSVAALAIGLVLIVLAILSERPGRARRIIVTIRNSVLVLVVLASLFGLFLAIVGPLH